MKKTIIQRKQKQKTSNLKGRFFPKGGSNFFTPVQLTIDSALRIQAQDLNAGVKQFFEPKIGFSLGNVKIHTSKEAAQSAEMLNAEAYTYGNNIFFNEGKYQPHSQEGKKLLAHELTHVAQQRSKPAQIQRKMKLPFHDEPAFNSADPFTSQSEIIQDYFDKLCPDAQVTIAADTVDVPDDFCLRPEPDALEPNPLSKAELSKTPVSCGCLCDLDESSKEVSIKVDDDIAGLTEFTHESDEQELDAPRGATVTVPSPSGKKTEQTMKSGKKETFEPFIVFGHELCGHAWLAVKGELQKDENAERGRGGHQETVRRENLMRLEHGLTERNTFREPFCGEVDDSDYQKECKIWRDEYNKINGTNFTLADTIPENTLENKPADFTFDVFFNKDMPQSWFNPASSFDVSVTSTGKSQFEEAVNMLNNFHPGKNFQLEGHASIEKPANDPTYNIRLSKRRVDLILKELVKQGVDASRLKDKADSSCENFDDGLKNCSDTESSTSADAKDRRVVIRIF